MEKNGCPGFQAAGVAAGLKKDGHRDLGLIYSETDATVAGIFTRNRVQAAPVLLDRQRIVRGSCRALIANSGNANCCTGSRGLQDAMRMARLAGEAAGVAEEDVLVASTGVIGEPLPIEKIEAAIPGLVKALRSEGIGDFAEAIMTTDNVPKVVQRRGELEGHRFTVTGVGKGAGMIRPDMATMLCFVMTDIGAAPPVLQEILVAAAARSLNRITVDGDTSTNDTALIMANGRCGGWIEKPPQRRIFQAVLDDVMITLAKWLVKDAEGATKLVEISVRGAQASTDARRVADTVANSPLFKTALFGEDANWGRIMAAVGRAGVAVDPARIDVFFGSTQMVKNGTGCGPMAEAEATQVLKHDTLAVTIDLNLGKATETVFTCDFSVDYVKINADYRS